MIVDVRNLTDDALEVAYDIVAEAMARIFDAPETRYTYLGDVFDDIAIEAFQRDIPRW